MIPLMKKIMFLAALLLFCTTGCTLRPISQPQPTEPSPIAEQPAQPSGKCGIENCHGMDIVCGANPAEMCTEIYMAGDNCRQFASCAAVAGKCQLQKSAKFESCKTCVEKCTSANKNNQIEFFECESRCAQ